MPETQGSGSLPGVLAAIVGTKRQELAALRAHAPALERMAASAPGPRDFEEAVRGGATVALIAECKRRSPGAGEIRPGLDVPSLVRGYEANGAAALSVLTDNTYFGGTAADLRAARAAVAVPVLRKDFTLDPLHVLEARAAGADAVLLIARILDDARLRSLREAAESLRMSALVEAHDAVEVQRALASGARIVGINNRDLATFTTRLNTTLELLAELPGDVAVVSESGIHDRAEVELLGAAGVDAVLVGEALLRDPDPGAAAGALAGVSRSSRGAGRER